MDAGPRQGPACRGREQAEQSDEETDSVPAGLIDDDLEGGVNRQEVEDIAAFLRALSDPNFFKDEPATVPSGLPVGGL